MSTDIYPTLIQTALFESKIAEYRATGSRENINTAHIDRWDLFEEENKKTIWDIDFRLSNTNYLADINDIRHRLLFAAWMRNCGNSADELDAAVRNLYDIVSPFYACLYGSYLPFNEFGFTNSIMMRAQTALRFNTLYKRTRLEKLQPLFESLCDGGFYRWIDGFEDLVEYVSQIGSIFEQAAKNPDKILFVCSG